MLFKQVSTNSPKIRRGIYVASTRWSLTSIRRHWRRRIQPNKSTIEYHRRSQHSQSLSYFHTLLLAQAKVFRYTRENKPDHIRKDLSAIIEEDEEEIDKTDSKGKKNLRHASFLFELDDRRVFWQLINISLWIFRIPRNRVMDSVPPDRAPSCTFAYGPEGTWFEIYPSNWKGRWDVIEVDKWELSTMDDTLGKFPLALWDMTLTMDREARDWLTRKGSQGTGLGEYLSPWRGGDYTEYDTPRDSWRFINWD
jgi:hypothetical protein